MGSSFSCKCMVSKETEEFEFENAIRKKIPVENDRLEEGELNNYFAVEDLKKFDYDSIQISRQDELFISKEFTEESLPKLQMKASDMPNTLHDLELPNYNQEVAKAGKAFHSRNYPRSSYYPNSCSSPPLEIINENNREGTNSHRSKFNETASQANQPLNSKRSKHKRKGEPIQSAEQDELTRWKRIEIDNIISRVKLKHLCDDEVVLNGDLLKLATEGDSLKYQVKSYAFVSRFCVVTKTHFSYFTSKSNFMRLTKPSFVCKISEVKGIDNIQEEFFEGIKLKKRKGDPLFCFCLKLAKTDGESFHLMNQMINSEEICSVFSRSLTPISRENPSHNSKDKRSVSQLGKSYYLRDRTVNTKRFSDMMIFATPDLHELNTWLAMINFLSNLSK